MNITYSQLEYQLDSDNGYAFFRTNLNPSYPAKSRMFYGKFGYNWPSAWLYGEDEHSYIVDIGNNGH